MFDWVSLVWYSSSWFQDSSIECAPIVLHVFVNPIISICVLCFLLWLFLLWYALLFHGLLSYYPIDRSTRLLGTTLVIRSCVNMVMWWTFFSRHEPINPEFWYNFVILVESLLLTIGEVHFIIIIFFFKKKNILLNNTWVFPHRNLEHIHTSDYDI